MRIFGLIIIAMVVMFQSAYSCDERLGRMENVVWQRQVNLLNLNQYQAKGVLDLSRSNIKDSDVASIIAYLNRNPQITALNLSGNNDMTATGYVPFAKVASLTILNLSKSSITCSGDVCEGALSANDMPDFVNNKHIISLNLSGHRIKDAGAIALAKNSTLRELNLAYNRVGTDGAIALVNNSQIENLNVGDDAGMTGVGDEVAQAILRNKYIKTLNISFDHTDEAMKILAKSTILQDLTIDLVSDSGAVAISKNTSLEKLTLVAPQMTSSGAKALASMHILTELNLYGCGCGDDYILDEGAVALAQNKNLKVLRLSIQNISDAGVIALSHMKNLEVLRLFRGDKITDASLRELAKNATQLKELDLVHTSITDRGMIALATMPNLQTLRLSINKIGDKGAEALSHLASLQDLNLYANDVHEDGALALATMHSLRKLNISHNQLTPLAISALKNSGIIELIV